MFRSTTLTLLSTLTFLTFHAQAAACSAQQVRQNQYNTLILTEQMPSAGIPKTIEYSLKSADGFAQGSAIFHFSRCGALTEASITQRRNYVTAKSTMEVFYSLSLQQQDYGWRSALVFDNSLTDSATQKKTPLFKQQLQGVYLLDRAGIIRQAGDRMEMTVGGELQVGNAITQYVRNAAGQLVRVQRRSNILADNSTTTLAYDDAGHLISQKSAAQESHYRFDESGREISLSSVQIYATIEKAETTCQQWNQYGQCTLAKRQITLITPGEGAKKDIVRQHNLTFKTDYTFWE